jgi:hypothetical protein
MIIHSKMIHYYIELIESNKITLKWFTISLCICLRSQMSFSYKFSLHVHILHTTLTVDASCNKK